VPLAEPSRELGGEQLREPVLARGGVGAQPLRQPIEQLRRVERWARVHGRDGAGEVVHLLPQLLDRCEAEEQHGPPNKHAVSSAGGWSTPDPRSVAATPAHTRGTKRRTCQSVVVHARQLRVQAIQRSG
jgi:hypothetical protein